ncbi:MAG: hypothetical protein EHM24_25945, partial [Acidobacteria bacterium]
LQVLARLSAFIAHDLKNAVAGLSLLAANAPLHLHKPAFQADVVRTLEQVTRRMQGLLSALAAPGSLPAGTAEPIALAPAVETWLRDMAGSVPARIRLESGLAWAGAVRGDPERLRSVLQNLVLNAVEAVVGAGTVRVETGLAQGQAVLTVSDTGRGMSPDFLRTRLFRPFQTTKSRGLGIGLYQCRHLIQAMGGTLTAESVEGRGTRMTIRLPAEPEAEHPAAPGRPGQTESFGEMAPAAALGRLM